MFNDGKPLMSTPNAGNSGPTLARLTTDNVRPWLGAEPLFSQGQHAGSTADPEVASLQASRLHGPPIIFLGLQEENVVHALPSSEFSAKKDVQAVVSNVHGTPYFSVDVTELEEQSVSEVLRERSDAGSVKLEFLDGRAAMASLTQFDSAVFAEAKSLVDWTARNRVSSRVFAYHRISNFELDSIALAAGPLSIRYGQAGNTPVRHSFPGLHKLQRNPARRAKH